MKEPRFKKELFIAIVFLLILLSFNFVLRQTTRIRILSNTRSTFEEVSVDIKNSMEDRITRYESLLYFGRKLFEVTGVVDRLAFATFFSERLSSEKERYGAVDTIAFVEKVVDKNAFVSRVRQEKTKSGLQFLYFNLNNANDKKVGYIMNYLVPHDTGSRYFGYDFAESEELMGELKKSEEKDEIRLTNPLNILQRNKVILVEPVYKLNNNELKSRTDSLIGYIVLILTPEKLFDNVFNNTNVKKTINTRVYPENKGNDELIYIDINNSDVDKVPKSERLNYTQTLPFNGKNLRLVTESTQLVNLTPFEQILPDLIFFGGSILVISFFIIMVSFKMKCDEDQKGDLT